MPRLTHFDAEGKAAMVDVSAKAETERSATAKGSVLMQPATLALIAAGEMKKGDVLAVARLAGIMAAKRTSELIPLCHPLMLTYADVEVTLEKHGVRIIASAAVMGQTGVEMEALTAAATAALTVYDMTKALDKGIEIQDLYLLDKTGGKSGDFHRVASSGAKQ
jgi:cyclic pyranopterin phosphate synthase